jgi:hypothetical protein
MLRHKHILRQTGLPPTKKKRRLEGAVLLNLKQ